MAESEGNHLNITIKSQDDYEMHFKIKPHMQFKRLMETYCLRRKLDIRVIRFLHNGTKITKKQTPFKVGMQDGDQVEAFIETTGGGESMMV